MEQNKLINTLVQSVTRVNNKELLSAVESLKTNNDSLNNYLMNNDVAVTEFQVAQLAMDMVTKMLNKRVNISVIKNVYSEYSLMFLINMINSKSSRSKLEKIYFDVITNTDNFDLYVVVNVNKKKISGNSLLEIFWLLPLFSNVGLLTSFDYKSFISEMKEVGNKNPDFVSGYEYYTTMDLSNFDKTAYKQFLVDGVN